MNKKVLTAAVALLMILSTILMAVPVNAITNPLPVFSNASGAAGSHRTVTAPGAALVTGLTANREVFVFFDKEVADYDLGALLTGFVTGAVISVGDEVFVATAGFPVGVYTPGDPIYLVSAGAVTNVKGGDTRLTPVTKGANVYGAGTTVLPTDADVGDAYVAMPTNVQHTTVGCNALPCPVTVPPFSTAFNWARGDGIYILDPGNVAAGSVLGLVGPGDLRARYPSVTVTLAGTGITATYAAWTKVYSPVLDFQKPIYSDVGVGNVGTVGAGDFRLRNVVIPQVRYPAGSTVLPGQQDLALVTTAFAATDAFADTNNNG
ncbi:MAG: hypothetical protein WCC94_06280, partial [Candidatus Bathyarchaeia archaeon]